MKTVSFQIMKTATFTGKMKKLFKRATLLAFTLIAALAITSCESTKAETKQSKNTTFVNTKAFPDGKVFTIMVFDEITSVKLRSLKESAVYEIPLSDCKYNSATSELSVIIPKECKIRKSDIVYTITGVAKFPAEFVLAEGNHSRAKPGVFVNGKTAVEGTDYTFNAKTGYLKFLISLDADKDSYELDWLTTSGTNMMSNKPERFEKEYKTLRNNWFRTIK